MSFTQYSYFISTIEIIFKQLGTLLAEQDYLGRLARVLTMMLSLAKQFSGHLKELDTADAAQDTNNDGSTLNRFVGKQSKACLRKGLKISKQLFRRFSYNQGFV